MMSTEVNVLRMMENLKYRLKQRNNRQVWSLYIDLKSAFDTVNHEILFKKLKEKKINQKLINTVEWIYE